MESGSSDTILKAWHAYWCGCLLTEHVIWLLIEKIGYGSWCLFDYSVGISSSNNSCSRPTISSLRKASPAWCSTPGLWNTSNLYSGSRSRHRSSFLVASARFISSVSLSDPYRRWVGFLLGRETRARVSRWRRGVRAWLYCTNVWLVWAILINI